jgi:bla regulator protein blaR1
VVDQTGLKGAYNFTLKWRSEQSVAASTGQQDGDDAPSLFTALQEQLGLRLVPSKAPVEVIVIDHIERPSEN